LALEQNANYANALVNMGLVKKALGKSGEQAKYYE